MKTFAARRAPGAREVALMVVRDTFGDQPRAAREAMDYRLRRSTFSARDRAFATELAYGAIKMRRALDARLAPFLGAKAATLPKPIAEILRLGAYQLVYMNGVEAYAAVSESVGLARIYGHKGTAGLVNAVLRRVADDLDAHGREDAIAPDEGAEPGDDAIGRRASLPTWLVAHWRKRFGAERLAAIVAGVNAPAPIGIGFDRRRIDADAARALLAEHGAAARLSTLSADTLVASDAHGIDIETLGAGRWFLHAESAALPVDLLAPQPGEHVYEACSGRGNKTLQIVARLDGRGALEAVDLDARKIERLRERLAVHDAAFVRVAARDAALPGEADCDAVLVDAPCSGIGIVGRQPEARWRKTPDEGVRLAPAQAAILTAAATRVKPGGRLVYAVCSTDAREGDEIVDAFLGARPEFARAALPERYAPFATPAGDVLVPPGIEGRDGFFIASVFRQASVTARP
jgi:16S rRNA (cytosine967-C5)-methyltransferase